jgi:OLD-like protein
MKAKSLLPILMRRIYGSGRAATMGQVPHLSAESHVRAVVLVEGVSDQTAVETLAARSGRDLAAEGVAVVPIGGAQAIGRFVERYGPQGLGLRLAGLCDAAEERNFQRALERAGLGACLTRLDLEEHGFYVCEADLEDELIRALGAAAVEEVLASNGDLNPFRTFQKQPAWRGRPADHQLRRFMGSADSRKLRYARLLLEALPLERVPRPLVQVLESTRRVQ